MKRLIALSALALVAVTSSVSLAETQIGVSINLGNAPPPPVVVVRQEPHVVFIPSSSVYVVNDSRWDYDTFRYGVYWYAYRGNYWYRARTWRGPYAVVAANRVPRAIINVPARNWKHHPHGMPPGQAKFVENDRRVYVKDHRDDRHDDYGHDKGHGNGKGHGKGHK